MRARLKQPSSIGGMIVNTDVPAVVEKKEEEKSEAGGTECVFVELGKVSEETKSGLWGTYDLGGGRNLP
jgi:hypothetical protein